MCPRAADPTVRDALIHAAARLLADDGPAGLTTRRLAAEVGTSTMMIYTHFGSMAELHAEIRREGFDRLAAAIRSVPDGEDPLEALVAGCTAYLRQAIAEPELYRATVNHRPPPGDDAGGEVFAMIIARVRRQVAPADVDGALCARWAGELWAASHGAATLALAGVLGVDQVVPMLDDMTRRLAVGFVP